MKPRNITIAIVISFLFAGAAQAAVSAEEAKQLGSTLTPWGAEKAGNKEGTIPAYVATPTKAPAGWDPKSPGNRPNPYRDKPLFSITAQNYPQYADKLDGMVQLFKKYPNFRMDIYPARRTIVLPQYVIDNSLKNATSCKAVNDGNTLEGCYGGVPFPIPKTGQEVTWNHLMAFRGFGEQMASRQWIVPTAGAPVMTNYTLGWQNYPMYDPKRTTSASPKQLYWQLRLDYAGPARQVGEKLVMLDPIDQVNVGRRAYQYIPGQRRVKLAPDLAYDTPSPVSGGGGTMDSAQVFMGALDRFEWKLVGKKEKFIPYNNYDITDPKVCPFEKMLTRNFANPDCQRWELHRVWVVKATLKPSFRHIYPKRDMYWDEDNAGVGMSENYDASGNLFRFAYGQSYPYYEEEGGYPVSNTTIEMDLQRGTWYLNGGTNEAGLGYHPAKPQSDVFFSPEALAGEGVR